MDIGPASGRHLDLLSSFWVSHGSIDGQLEAVARALGYDADKARFEAKLGELAKAEGSKK